MICRLCLIGKRGFLFGLFVIQKIALPKWRDCADSFQGSVARMIKKSWEKGREREAWLGTSC